MARSSTVGLPAPTRRAQERCPGASGYDPPRLPLTSSGKAGRWATTSAASNPPLGSGSVSSFESCEKLAAGDRRWLQRLHVGRAPTVATRPTNWAVEAESTRGSHGVIDFHDRKHVRQSAHGPPLPD
jgi:hypothetical protein